MFARINALNAKHARASLAARERLGSAGAMAARTVREPALPARRGAVAAARGAAKLARARVARRRFKRGRAFVDTGHMSMAQPSSIPKDDPRQLRVLFERAAYCSRVHHVSSVFVGVAGDEGDLLARDFLDFVESELRVEDAIFRMLRERAVLLMTDIDEQTARKVMERLVTEFAARFGPSAEISFDFGYFAVAPGKTPTVKDVLPALFSARE
jgi:hypothetical protein